MAPSSVNMYYCVIVRLRGRKCFYQFSFFSLVSILEHCLSVFAGAQGFSYFAGTGQLSCTVERGSTIIRLLANKRRVFPLLSLNLASLSSCLI